jgi:ribose transport system substrate-binding protein
MAYDVAHGYKPTVAERMLKTGGVLVTKENVEWFMDLKWGKSTLPYDWRKMSKVLHPEDWDPQNRVAPWDPEELWAKKPKPEGFSLPKEYDGFQEDYQRVKEMYKKHYTSKFLDSPTGSEY